MRELIGRIRRGVMGLIALAIALWMLAAYFRHQSRAARATQRRRELSARFEVVAANRANKDALDAAQRANQIKQSFQARRDALAKSGQTTAVEILNRLNAHARIDPQ